MDGLDTKTNDACQLSAFEKGFPRLQLLTTMEKTIKEETIKEDFIRKSQGV